jgi:endonuclease I
MKYQIPFGLKRLLLSFIFFFGLVTWSPAQIPSGYYDPVQGLYGDTLRFELSKIIGGHISQTYTSLWSHYWNTDRRPDSTVWDMYSDNPGGTPPYTYQFFTDQCGNYSGEGSCYNREHSFPKSWWGGSSGTVMFTDMFHVVPSDGYVNGQRGNLAYGETNNPNWTSLNGGKRGPSSTPGYSGTVFEPIDEYKGDFARGYFYMLTRYYSQISSWNSDMLSNGDFSTWAKDLLLDWAKNDTVSQKELNRNEGIYTIQQNRNPYIDHPDYAKLVWGDSVIVGIESLNRDNQGLKIVGNAAIIFGLNGREKCSIRIFDISGRIRMKREFSGFDEGEFKVPAGINFIQFISKQQIKTYKVWVE